MPWAAHPDAAPSDPALDVVTSILDPVLVPLGFAPGQVGAARGGGQVIFCRGDTDSGDGGCTDLVVVLEEATGWHVVEVRYWAFAGDRWRLELHRDTTLAEQVSDLAGRLPGQLAS